jgi:Arm DNA-binding domain
MGQIGKRDIAALQPGQVIWDGAISGFGARRQVGTVSYMLIYRTAEGRQRWHTIGRHGSPWTPDTARREAKRLLGSVAGGLDPAALKKAKRSAQSVAELCDWTRSDAPEGCQEGIHDRHRSRADRAAYQAAARHHGRAGRDQGRC